MKRSSLRGIISYKFVATSKAYSVGEASSGLGSPAAGFSPGLSLLEDKRQLRDACGELGSEGLEGVWLVIVGDREMRVTGVRRKVGGRGVLPVGGVGGWAGVRETCDCHRWTQSRLASPPGSHVEKHFPGLFKL